MKYPDVMTLCTKYPLPPGKVLNATDVLARLPEPESQSDSILLIRVVLFAQTIPGDDDHGYASVIELAQRYATEAQKTCRKCGKAVEQKQIYPVEVCKC